MGISHKSKPQKFETVEFFKSFQTILTFRCNIILIIWSGVLLLQIPKTEKIYIKHAPIWSTEYWKSIESNIILQGLIRYQTAKCSLSFSLPLSLSRVCVSVSLSLFSLSLSLSLSLFLSLSSLSLSLSLQVKGKCTNGILLCVCAYYDTVSRPDFIDKYKQNLV